MADLPEIARFIRPLANAIGRRLEGVAYWCLASEASAESALALKFFHGGFTELRFDRDLTLLMSWDENRGWSDHFSLAIEPGPVSTAAIESYHQRFDSTAGHLWRAHRGEELLWARILGWNMTPHVVEFGFRHGSVVVADGYQEPFGDGDDIVHWPADSFWGDFRTASVEELWRSAEAPPSRPADG